MSAGHRTAKLSDPEVAEVILGQSPPSSAYNERGEGLPFFQGKADFGLLYPVPRIWCDSGQKFAAKGDVLMSVRAPVGDVNKATDDCVIGRGIAALRAGRRTDPWFLLFALEYCRPILESRSTGSTFASVNKATLEDLDIPFPDLPEQQGIGKALAFLVERIADEDRLLKVAQDLKRAAMRALFTKGLRGEAQKDTEIGPVPESWDVVDFAKVRDWLQYGTSTHCTYEVTDYPVLRIPNIEPGYVKPEDIKYAKLSRAEAERYVLQDGDLIFIRTNGVIERLGACAVYAGQPEGALFASYLIRARLKRDQVEPRYVAYFYASDLGTSIVAGRATPAADGKYNLNTGTIDSLPLPLPPTLDEQREIVAILDAIDRKIDLHKRKRAVLEELFKSLLHKLMTGEIRVADLDLSALDANAPEGAAA